MTHRWAGAGLAILLGAALGHAADDVFDARMKEAEDNERSSAGELYAPEFGKMLSTNYAPWLNECGQRLGNMPSDAFAVLLKLNATGTVEEGLVRPRTTFSECFMDLAKKATFPKPPSLGYWVAARMQFSKQ